MSVDSHTNGSLITVVELAVLFPCTFHPLILCLCSTTHILIISLVLHFHDCSLIAQYHL